MQKFRRFSACLIGTSAAHIATPVDDPTVEQRIHTGWRIAIIDPDEELQGVLGLFLDEGHTSRATQLREEMRSAGYHHQASHDFLPIQRFEVFGVDPG